MPASPTIGTIRSAIVTAIKSALNSGAPGTVTTVSAYRRFWRDQQKFEAIALRTDSGGDVPAGTLNFWMVTRHATKEVEAESWYRFFELHRFRMYGYMGVQDITTGPGAGSGTPSEQMFQDQIENIRDNLRLNTAVFGNTEKTSPVVQVLQFERVEIGQAGAWEAILELEAEGIEEKIT